LREKNKKEKKNSVPAQRDKQGIGGEGFYLKKREKGVPENKK